MVIRLRVIPGSGRNLVIGSGGYFKVYLTRPARDGLANQQLIKVIAEHFKVKKYEIKIIKGVRSRDKLPELPEAA